ncbi:MAG: lipopolysaccharide transport periplasmic protein LptA [Gammaproteobacteria bacterium]|nr:lipopolysaccharide transport periplasmic protein LptA [Gammaproteobacteria bacterium]
MKSFSLSRSWIIALFFLAGACVAPYAHAAKTDQDEPIRVNARSVEADEKTGVAVYSGDVEAQQGRLSIRADRLEIRTHDRQTEFIRATGKPAKLLQQASETTEEMQADAERIDYHVADKKLDMMGNVRVQRNQDLFTGDVLHYDLKTKSLNAAGDKKSDGRIHAVLQPKKTNNETAPRP